MKHNGSNLEAHARISARPVALSAGQGGARSLKEGPLAGLKVRDHSVPVCWEWVHPSDLIRERKTKVTMS